MGLTKPPATFDRAGVLVLPIPFEATVSYGGGTADGPAAIITASQQVELYDREYDDEPAVRYGVHTLPALALPEDPAAAVDAIAAAVAAGGAQRASWSSGWAASTRSRVGFGRGLLAALGGPLTVVQTRRAQRPARQLRRVALQPCLHCPAAAGRPGIEQVLQLGIRSVCGEEVDFVRRNPAACARLVRRGGARRRLAGEFIERVHGRRVFLTIDVDGLDPAIVPATGTPEPDGLTWPETLDILRTLTANAEVIGMDCVELAPVAGLHMADFAVAKLLYKAITYAVMVDIGDGLSMQSASTSE